MAKRDPFNEEQRLVDILVQMVLASTADSVFCNKSTEEKAAWIAKTLNDCGYENIPIGASWCHLVSVHT